MTAVRMIIGKRNARIPVLISLFIELFPDVKKIQKQKISTPACCITLLL
jgi:hypothetical protein